MKTCRKCKESQEEAAFPRNKSTADGFDSMCKTCWSAQSKERRKNGGWSARGRKSRNSFEEKISPPMLGEDEMMAIEIIRLEKVRELSQHQAQLWAAQGTLHETAWLFKEKFARLPTKVFLYKTMAFFEINPDEMRGAQ